MTSVTRVRQGGAALLLMMLVVLVAATATLVTRVNLNDARARQQTDAQDVLALAREALLDYAMVHPDMAPGEPAKLPCPDIDATGGWLEGEAHADSCGAQGETVIGRLPWRTLGVAPLNDSGGACLWYVVSGSHKDADTTSSAMINADSYGQVQLFSTETGQVIAGAQADGRPVALVIAPMRALGGQSRPAAAAGDQCSAGFDPADFLDSDAGTGISNASLSATPDVVDLFAVAAGYDSAHNDRVAAILPSDLARVTTGRHDHAAGMRALALAVTECIADYARNNAGGVNDRRLPWPAPLQLSDYRVDAQYDDADIGFLSGRLPDGVDDSGAQTGNSITRVLSDCDMATVPSWTPQMMDLWGNWKDHFFYAVAESYAPPAPVPSNCTTCLSVNGAGQFAAIVLFSGQRLQSLGQVRTAPPIDVDTKDLPANYLEGLNATSVPYASGVADFTSQAASGTFNDLLYCIDPALGVMEC